MNDICKSCGEHFTNHLGLEGTCRLLQERTKERDEARKAVKGWIKENGPGGWIDTLRAELKEVRGQCEQWEKATALANQHAKRMERERDDLKDQVFDLSQWESRGKYLEERMSVVREDAVSRFNRIKEYRARIAQLEDGLRAVQKHQVATGGEMAKHGSVYLICEKALNPENAARVRPGRQYLQAAPHLHARGSPGGT